MIGWWSKAKAIRFSTLDSICKVLNSQPADILEYAELNPIKK
jgi:putative transcriptional regulator